MIDIAKSLNDVSGIILAKGTTAILNCLFQGKIASALNISKEALDLAEEIGDIHSKAMALYAFGASLVYKGLFKEAEKILLETVVSCEKAMWYSWGAWANFFLGDIYYNTAEYNKSQYYYEQALLFFRKIKFFTYNFFSDYFHSSC